MGVLDRLRDGTGTEDDYRRLAERMPYARFLGISIVPEDRGFVTRLAFDEKLIGNPVLPALHGGVIGAFLETAAMFQVLVESEGDTLPKPITWTVAYLRSARPLDTLARATITKQGRRVASVRVEAWQDDAAKPVAAAYGQFLLASPAEGDPAP